VHEDPDVPQELKVAAAVEVLDESKSTTQEGEQKPPSPPIMSTTTKEDLTVFDHIELDLDDDGDI
jgi:hypothetical protein